MAFYSLPDELKKDDTLQIILLEADGDTIVAFSNHHQEKTYTLSPSKGINTFHWNLKYAPAKRFDGMVLWAGDMQGPKAIPGTYRLDLHLNDSLLSRTFRVLKDPRSSATEEDYHRYLTFANEVRDKITEAHKAIISIRDIRSQLQHFKDRLEQEDDLKKEMSRIDSVMTRIEEDLYQTRNRSNQDPLNFPVRLTNKLAYLNLILRNGEYPPTDQAYAVRAELESMIQEKLDAFTEVKTVMIPGLNRMMREKEIDAVILKQDQ